MTNQADSSQNGDGAEAQVNPPVSPAQGDKPNSSVTDEAIVERVLSDPRLSEQIASAVQSQKDKRFDKLEKQAESFETQLARYNKLIDAGASPAIALKALEEQHNTEAEQKSAGDAAPNVPVTDYVTVLSSMGLTGNEPEVKEIMQDGGTFQEHVVKFAALKANPPASRGEPGEVPQGVGGGGAPLTDASGGGSPSKDLAKQYQEELKGVRQGDVDAVIRIKQKYHKLGLNIF